jgi:hypothetical protein
MTPVLTVPIDGTIYLVNPPVNEFFPPLLELERAVESQRTIATTGQALDTLLQEGKVYSELWTNLSELINGVPGGGLTPPQRDAINDILNNENFKNAQIAYIENDNDALLAAIQGMRTDSAFAENIRGAVESLLTGATIARRLSIVDILATEYSIRGTEQLSREVGELTAQVKFAKQALFAINQIFNAAAQPDPDITYTASAMDITKTFALRSDIVDGRDKLKTLQLDGFIPEDLRDEVSGVLAQISFIARVIRFSGVLPSLSGGQTGVSGELQDWLSEPETTIGLGRAALSFDFLSEELQGKVKESLFVFLQFYDSSSSILQRVHRMMKKMGHSVDSAN